MTIRLVPTRSVLLVVLVTAVVVGWLAATAIARSTDSKPRLTVSHRVVLPGKVITLEVDGRGTRSWFSGMASEFEGRSGISWEPLYMLQSSGGGPPRVAPIGSPVNLIGIRDPVQVAIPPVEPGVYRITRQYSKGNREGGEPLVDLSARVTVKRCPAGTRPQFVGGDAASGDPGEKLGQPSCT